eukprot:gnl/MRDRNA2_/MRDRNA2_29221_c0_seq1.p1 gnl/MRDRNA2_/MRDRNA2_29221_c0~~gnl/MRDRNA2_/MRDRNA2_29221_c0_seq1.p1  ORF type:complete len:114 (+),score=11.89 gnl/MRDRNA2_/MRDRNA2_29221_c0_seq1:82-423(+)
MISSLGRNLVRCGTPMMKSTTLNAGAIGAVRHGGGGPLPHPSMYGNYPGCTTPGSMIKDPNPPGGYNDKYPDMGWGWWTLVGTATAMFIWGNWYDSSRPSQIVLKIFGPNAPM